MVGPLREALIAAARDGRLPPPEKLTDEEWRARLEAFHPGLTPEEIRTARRLAEALAAPDDFGI